LFILFPFRLKKEDVPMRRFLPVRLLLAVSLLTMIFMSVSACAEAPMELNVFAAASLTESLTAIGEAYEAANPNVKLSFNFDSSGTLQKQIESGAAADVFLSAAVKQMDALADGGYLLDDTRKDLLTNKVVLIVPEGSALGLKDFEGVAGEAVKLVALGNKDVPVGQYAEEIFRALGLWDAVSAKASLGANVKEVLSQVESGAVDCGVVYATDAATAKGVAVVAEAPEGSHKPVVYPGAVMKSSASADAAKAFLDFLSTPDAVAAFTAAGFTMAEATPAA
jgi:molybdate transport system substrate-binding protein